MTTISPALGRTAQLGSIRAQRGWSEIVGEQGEGPSLDALLQRASGGDEPAFAAMYDRTAARVYGVILRVLRDPAQSEEVAQEVFLELWDRSARFDPQRGTAVTWIMTVAHRRAVDRVRSEQSLRDRVERVAAAEPPAYDQVASSVEERAEHERVRRALAAVTDLQREAIELAYYGGRTYRQVADLLGVPLGTIKTRLRDGLRRLQTELDET